MFMILMLAFLAFAIPAVQAHTLYLKDVRNWSGSGYPRAPSVAIGNIDADPALEIVTGNQYWDGTRWQAQLAVWDGSSAFALSFQGGRTWYWVGETDITSVAIGDVDRDGSMEIVTGGQYLDGIGYVAQLCVWDGATLTLEGVKT